jgi:hypothetical protein
MKWRQHNNYYPDVALFLFFIPFISAFNYYLTYHNVSFGWFLFLTFTIDTVQGYAAWFGVRSFIIYLDKIWPYGNKPFLRIVVQFIGSTIIGLAVISLLTELTSWIAKGRPAPLDFYTFDLVIISIWFFVINGIYVGLYYFNTWRKVIEAREEEIRENSKSIIVQLGKQNIKVPFEDVTGFFVDGEYVVVSNKQGKKFYLDQSLDKTEKTLPNSLFFRLNRQVILHRQMVSGFKRIENGKLHVLVNFSEGFPSELIVSRTKASAFKGWFQQS